LRAAFSGSNFKEGQVSTRANRPVGHGFVDYHNEKDLNAALDRFAGKLQILGVEVKIEIARDPRQRKVQSGDGTVQENQTQGDGPRRNRNRNRRNRNSNDNGEGNNQQANTSNTFNSNQNFQQNNGQDNDGNNPGQKRRVRNRRNKNQDNDNNQFSNNGNQQQNGWDVRNTNNSNNNNFNDNANANPGRNRRNRNRNRNNGDQNNSPNNFNAGQNNANTNATDGPKPRRERPPREPRESVLSTTTVYVMNLPFSVDDNGLFNLFKDTNPKSARIHQRRFGKGKSRGVGYVEYENEAGQQNAIAKMDGVEVPNGDKPPRKIKVVVSETYPMVEKAENTATTQ
jgi:hypothetical protein